MSATAGGKSPEALEQAANQLDDVARRVLQIAQAAQNYQGRVGSIALGVEQEVGGSATGRHKRIASLLKGVAGDAVPQCRSAAASHQAAEMAKRLTSQARAEAETIRRQREAEQHNKQRTQRR